MSLISRTDSGAAQNPIGRMLRWGFRIALVGFVISKFIGTSHILQHQLPQLKEDLQKSAQGSEEHFFILTEISHKYAKGPLDNSQIQDAKESAEALLAEAASGNHQSSTYGNSLHYAHLALGRVSLRQGNIEEAKAQLKLAAQTPGSPNLDSFGPNFVLAKELLEKGEKAAVVDYIESCQRFWTGSEQKTLAWKQQIQQGSAPQFGANLRY